VAATRRKKPARSKRSTPAWIWLLSGILIGLGLAWFLWSRGYIPQPKVETATVVAPTVSGEHDEEVAPDRSAKKSRYEFFEVLPEMEVDVSDEETDAAANEASTPAPAAVEDGKFILQVASFRVKSDAEQMKARLALLGIIAQIQSVNVNDATWHRVRIGPVTGSARADELRRQLSDNDIDSLVMKAQ
jgi:cell division protein FtsN